MLWPVGPAKDVVVSAMIDVEVQRISWTFLRR